MATAFSSPVLLLAPTLLAAASVSFAATETMIIRAVWSAPAHVAGNDVFQALWSGFFPPGVTMAFVTSGGAAASGAYAWWLLPPGAAQCSLVGWASVAAAAHFAFGPAVAGLLDRMRHRPVDSRADTARWLQLHYVRTVLTDMASLALFLRAWFA